MFTQLFSLTIAALTIGLSQTAIGSTMVATTTPNDSQKLAYSEQSGPFRVNVSSLEPQLRTTA
jgi:hypothetical protein